MPKTSKLCRIVHAYGCLPESQFDGNFKQAELASLQTYTVVFLQICKGYNCVFFSNHTSFQPERCQIQIARYLDKRLLLHHICPKMRRPCIWSSSPFPAQKMRCLKKEWLQEFCRIFFYPFWRTQKMSVYLSSLPQIYETI